MPTSDLGLIDREAVRVTVTPEELLGIAIAHTKAATIRKDRMASRMFF
jgi:hypothetical protein